jgi:hypothetical protein
VLVCAGSIDLGPKGHVNRPMLGKDVHKKFCSVVPDSFGPGDIVGMFQLPAHTL